MAKYKLSDQIEDLDREFKDLVEKIRIVYGEKIHKGDNFVEALLTLIDVSRRHFLSSSFDEGVQVISKAERLMR